jgi:hypothetical protein
VEIVVGLSLTNLKPRVWEPDNEYHLDRVEAVMISYAEFDGNRRARREAMDQGLHEYLNVPEGINVYLDNGSFNFAKNDREVPRDEYEQFVENAEPDWYPIPQDYIPAPSMNYQKQTWCRMATMEVNRKYSHDSYVPVLHVGRYLEKYLEDIQSERDLRAKGKMAIGGIVPNLLRAHKALKYRRVLTDLQMIRDTFSHKDLHLFGVGGNSTLHVARLLGIDSVDSTGWRNRAARGIIQMPGSGDRSVRDLGSWEGRDPSDEEWQTLAECDCPACQQYGIDGLTAKKTFGFCNRATHNLWVLLDEARLIEKHLEQETYDDWYESHVENSTYKPLIDFLRGNEE